MLVPAKSPEEKKMVSIRMEACFGRWATGSCLLSLLYLRCIGSFPLPLGQITHKHARVEMGLFLYAVTR